MIYELGPITPIDVDAFRALIAPGEPAELSHALSPLVAQMNDQAGALDITHRDFAAAGETPTTDTDDEPLLRVISESQSLVDDPGLALDGDVNVTLDASDKDIDTLAHDLSGEAGIGPPAPSSHAPLTEEEIDAWKLANDAKG